MHICDCDGCDGWDGCESLPERALGQTEGFETCEMEFFEGGEMMDGEKCGGGYVWIGDGFAKREWEGKCEMGGMGQCGEGANGGVQGCEAVDVECDAVGGESWEEVEYFGTVLDYEMWESCGVVEEGEECFERDVDEGERWGQGVEKGGMVAGSGGDEEWEEGTWVCRFG